MSVRLKLSPLQRDIVMMLEEAGSETVGTVINTLKPLDQGEFAAQVDGLVSLGLIRKEENNLVLTTQGRIALRTQAILNWRNIAISLIDLGGLVFQDQYVRCHGAVVPSSWLRSA